MLSFGEIVDLNHRPCDRHIEGLPPRTSNNTERREVTSQAFDLRSGPAPRVAIKFVPAVKKKNETTVVAEQYKMLFAQALVHGPLQNELKQ